MLTKILILFLLTFLNTGASSKSKQAILESIFEGYDFTELPPSDDVIINVSLFVQEASIVSDGDYSYMQLQVYLRQNWKV